ncbi:electron transfer flavoprotein subunit alpha, partial [Escherichia coli]|nr:electron transfer flavoprotein subunit alpha [Escherichia coli]
MSQLNSVWVFSDNPERYAELFGGAQQWGQQVYAIVQNIEQAQAVMPYGPKCIYVLEQNDALQRTENYAESIAALLKDNPPAMLLLAATKRGKALAARLSVQLNAALVNDATAVDIVDGHICAEHRMYGGVACDSGDVDRLHDDSTPETSTHETPKRAISHTCVAE